MDWSDNKLLAPSSAVAVDADDRQRSTLPEQAAAPAQAIIHLAILSRDRSFLSSLDTQAIRRGISVSRLGDAQSILEQAQDVDIAFLDCASLSAPCHEIVRDLRSRSRMGVILLAEHSAASDRILALEFGADDYLSPIPETHEMLARIRSLGRRLTEDRRERSAETGFRFDDWRIDRLSRGVRNPAGIAIKLTAREFDALHLLLQNANRPVERARFHSESLSSDSRATDALVGRLRRKLLAAGAPKRLIRPVRSVGYLLSADVRPL